jgi:hypothetical protein
MRIMIGRAVTDQVEACPISANLAVWKGRADFSEERFWLP